MRFRTTLSASKCPTERVLELFRALAWIAAQVFTASSRRDVGTEQRKKAQLICGAVNNFEEMREALKKAKAITFGELQEGDEGYNEAVHLICCALNNASKVEL